ncbi:chondroitin AC/alginate lyase [Epithele typhae]|uniref:chondroitin AC/alginate lyase n=1 Tax=Epithele typhae TaxID=378194 RepID=UPI0020089ABE|nr:chondroitin AC/alginate lyase [Epithele typhae]KAH9944202.1 chondroitin AC/alginate lyase [Epithele typhae]
MSYNATYNHSNASNLHAPYNHSNASNPSPYGSGDPYYNESTGFITPSNPKKGTSKWIKIGIPVAVLVIAGAVVGAILGIRASKSTTGSSSTKSGSSSGNNTNNDGSKLFATATDSLYLLPIYPSTPFALFFRVSSIELCCSATNSALYTSPTISSGSTWPSDSFSPSNPSVTSVRSDRPRIIAPSYKWEALPTLISSNPYLKFWNDTIFGNATNYYSLPVVQYFMDGDSGILDNSREVKERVKAFSYVYRLTQDTKWVDRAWKELQVCIPNAAGNGTASFGPDGSDKWNPTHFLDTAEMTSAFGIAYDWLYDALTDDQKSQIRTSMLFYGLNPGLVAFNNSDNRFTGWWASNIEGNWNCVCNAGLTIGALAILETTPPTVGNAKQNCAWAVSTDGSWSETANYWYFGTTGHAEMASALMTATGSDYDLLTVNPNFYKTGLFHMSITGPGSLFSWGDHGPNKFSSTANSMLLYGDQFKHPEYILFQRDQHDAPEPWSVFWYNPAVQGAFWDGLALDNFFDNNTDQWASLRSSWTDENAMYIGIKAGTLQGHQTHNDLDCGDFVLDALGTRWAGELGSGDYRSLNYFSNDTQQSDRWLYYRKRTEGQNTILVNKQNQLVAAAPTTDTALWTADITSAYLSVTSFKRGIRYLNGRKQVLLQDDINASGDIMWRMHTNATVTVDGTTATLKIGDQTLTMSILNAPSGVSLTTGDAVRFSDDPALPAGQVDQENPGVTVVMISLPAGQYSLQVLFNPQWDGMSSSDFVTPPSVAIDSWTLRSHD